MPHVIRLMSQIPRRHFPKCRSSQQGRKDSHSSTRLLLTRHSRLTTIVKLRRARDTIASYRSQTST